MPTEYNPRTLSQLPGPKGLPLLGNLLQLNLQKLHIILEDWADSYGDIYKFKLVHKTIVVISDTDLIQKILRDRPQTYRRISAVERISHESGNHGVFAAEGDQWRRQRYVTMQAFKSENLRLFFPTLYQITTRLHHRWSNLATIEQVIDVRSDWMRFTVDVTTQFAFGYDINLLKKDDDSFQRHLERQLPAFNRRLNAPFPYWHFVKLPSDRAMEKSLTVIEETIKSFIRQTRERLTQQPELTLHPTNFLEALLVNKDEDGIGFSDAEIQGNIMTMLLAGEDTTAHSLSWLLYLMADHPDVQLKMQQEADAVLGDVIIPTDISTTEKLSYIEAVIYETLRLKSVAPLLFMEPNFDVELNGMAIPAGTTLMLLTRYAAIQEKNFTDAVQFKPERWLESTATNCTHNRNTNIPFGAGPRFCPGRNLAILEMKIALAMMCKSFSVIRVDTDHPVQEVFSFTMLPDNLKIKLKNRF
jgi:cytochrome P450